MLTYHNYDFRDIDKTVEIGFFITKNVCIRNGYSKVTLL